MSKVSTHVDGEGFTMTQPGATGPPPPYGAPPGNRNFSHLSHFSYIITRNYRQTGVNWVC